jgi:hypothetical protein
MITTNRLFEISQAVNVALFNDFIIPFDFAQNQSKLIITITNTSNYNQVRMGDIIPFSEYNINGELDYFQQTIYSGNSYLEVNAIDDFKLKFRAYRNGNYFITIDEIIQNSQLDNIPTIQDIINVVRNGENLLIPPVTVTTTPTKILNANPLRRSFALRNTSNNTVFVSLDNIVNSNDYECILERNKVELFPIPYMGEIWAVTNTGIAIVGGVECVYSQII